MGMLVSYYKEFKQREEALDNWRKGMYDKVRQQARTHLSALRNGYQVDEIEQWFRDVTYNEIYDKFGEVHIVDYAITPQGIVINFWTDTSPRTEVATFTWDDISKLEERENEESKETSTNKELGSEE